MPIQKEEIRLKPGEMKLKVEYVFLEKSISPTSMTGDGIPQGILMLTNKRLFFFAKGEGRSKGNLILRETPGFIASTVAGFAGEVVEKLVHLSEIGVEYILEELEYSKDFEHFLNNEFSFVVPIKKIVSCKKFGSFLGRMVGFPVSKSRYFSFGIQEYPGTITNYCIYSINPKNPLNRVIKYHDWFEEISELIQRDIFCVNCGESNSLRSNYCNSCGSPIQKY